MRARSAFCLAMLVTLASCTKQEPPALPAVEEPAPPAPVVVQEFLPLKTETLSFTRQVPACKGKACGQLTVDMVRFPDNPALSALVEKELVGLVQAPINQGESTVDAYAADFLARADKRSAATLKARLLRQTGPLVLLRLDTGLYTGGAHGMPVTAFLNYDRHLNRRLQLDDVVQDGHRPALVELARKAHEAWLVQHGFTDPDFRRQWPFVETDNFALTAEGLVLAYNVYAIAPYSEGQPELLLSYADLANILKPEWILPTP